MLRKTAAEIGMEISLGMIVTAYHGRLRLKKTKQANNKPCRFDVGRKRLI
jgi:hypothetical protein